MYELGLRESAEAELAALPERIRRQVDRRLRALVSQPRPAGAVKLKGSSTTYRIRSGDYRIVYEVDDQLRRVVVSRIRHRRDAYRGL